MEIDLNDYVSVLISQRNAAQNEAAQLTALVQKLRREIDGLHGELAAQTASAEVPAAQGDGP